MSIDEDLKGKVILAVSAHPDDIDVLAGGTVAKFAQAGAEIYYLILTDGTKGHEDHQMDNTKLKELRRSEETEAANCLGVKKVIFCDFVDGELENNHECRKEVVKLIRQIKPEIVITMDPTFVYDSKNNRINHPDHRMAGQITLDAVFPFARNSRTFPELINQGLEPHIVNEVLLASSLNPNYFIDITETFDSKMKAIKAHTSQFSEPEKVCHRMTVRAKKTGEKAGYKYAESFARVVLSF